MKKSKVVIVTILMLSIVIMIPYKNFSADLSWLVRYKKEDKIIDDLIKEAEAEQTKQNVAPQDDDNKVFDIIIFMGQSNIVGQGDASKAVKRINDNVGFEMEFNSAGEPYGLSKIEEPFGDKYGNSEMQPADWPKFTPAKGSMVTAFMNSYYLNTGVPVVGIPAGVSGSSIYEYWQDGQDGIKTAKAKYEKTYAWMKSKGYKVRHSYMVWYQGESDVGKYIDSDGDKIYTNGTITYENALKNIIKEMQNVGIERCFLISIGGYYVLEGYENEANREIYMNYENMIQHQKQICENNDWVTLVSTRAETLSKCADMMSDTEINGVLYRCGNHLNQEALDIVGSEAGKNVAKYADQARRQTLTEKQSNALISFGKNFAKEGTDAEKLVYGINNKAAAYNLQLVNYPYHTTESGTQLIWFGPKGEYYGWNGETNANEFKPNYYIGLDCSGFVAFLYHRVFGLPFNYKYNNMINPWTTKEFIENRKIKTFDGEVIEAFKIVYEQHAKEQKYTLNDLASLADLQPGDLLIGRGGASENDNTNHIVIYSGMGTSDDGKTTKHKMLHATYSSDHYFSEQNKNGKYYNMGECDLDKSEYKFRNVYVYRLNDNIIPEDFIYNDKPIDWNKFSDATEYSEYLKSNPYDDMEPIIEKIEGNPTEWTNQDVTITVSAKDDGRVITNDEGINWEGVGLADQAYSFDGGENWQESNQKTFSENSRIRIKVKDKAGNITGSEVNITKIDKIAPTILGIEGNPTEWTENEVTIKINAIDSEGVGLADKAYSFDGGKSWQESNQKTFKENTVINIKVKDKLENIQQTTVNITNIVKLEDIAIKTMPNKRVYYVQDELNTEGLKLTAIYDNGITEEIDSGYTCTPTKLLEVGNQVITVTYKNKQTTFEVKVVEKATYTITSDIYNIEGTIIKNIQPNTNREKFKENIKTTSNLKIYNNENEEVKNGELIKTGNILKLDDGKKYILVVIGDVNNDGKSDIKDIMIINKYRLNKIELLNELLIAGDVNNDEKCDIKDILIINKYRLGKISTL